MNETSSLPIDNSQQSPDIQTISLAGLYENWFLDYASYVILDRAIPAIDDGLKPVQRRILHAMHDMHDGRFHKVANVIGQTMQYHPHGDAAIGEALVNMGQKELLIDTQGNWGDYRTGDSAAAPRYIEAKLSPFAIEVAFNPDTTEWQTSYDGRKNEPIALPMKFPLLLAHGTEGIAVGLATKILPHNFCELCLASIAILKGEKTQILPDFPTGGSMDAGEYNGGLRGGKIRVRAKIELQDKKTLIIREIPFGTTTSSIQDSIVKASEKGKIKIKKVTDITAKDVEISIELLPGTSPDITIDALYAFTECETSLSPNACVIVNNKPRFLSVDELLEISTYRTKALLQQELEIRLHELEEKRHFASLEKIFIENRIYRNIEECETWESVIQTIDTGLEPFKSQFYRIITEEDIVRLTEIQIKRISKYDGFKADESIRKLAEEMKEVRYNLAHLTEYAIVYFENLLKKYGKGRERHTQIQTFDTIIAQAVVANNAKLYVNRKDGFIGSGLKKDEFVCDCSDIDDIIVFRSDGKMVVSQIADKVFVGKDILYVGVWKKGDDRMIYNLIYTDLKEGKSYAKRFAVTAITRDREYEPGKAGHNAKVQYLSANPNGEAEIITIHLSLGSNAKKKVFEFDFSELAVKGRSSIGNTVTKYSIRKVEKKMSGASTLGGRTIWYDETIGRLNADGRGKKLGVFNTGDLILAIYNDGTYEQTSFELSNHYDFNRLLLIEKYRPDTVISVVYFDGAGKLYYVKRFVVETGVAGKKYSFISENANSRLEFVSLKKNPVIEYTAIKGKSKEAFTEQLSLKDFIEIKGWKAMGNRLSQFPVIKITEVETGEPEVENKNLPEEETEQVSNRSKEKEKDEFSPIHNSQFTIHNSPAVPQLEIGASVEWDLEKKTPGEKPAPPGQQGNLF